MYFISKIIFTMMFWVIVARWSYAEVAKFSPMLRESIDRVLEVAVIPTHDQWDMQQITEFGRTLASSFKVNEAFAGEDTESYKR